MIVGWAWSGLTDAVAVGLGIESWYFFLLFSAAVTVISIASNAKLLVPLSKMNFDLEEEEIKKRMSAIAPTLPLPSTALPSDAELQQLQEELLETLQSGDTEDEVTPRIQSIPTEDDQTDTPLARRSRPAFN